MSHRLKTLNIIPKNSIGLEIGVWTGDFSQLLLNNVSPSRLYLADPWLFQPISVDGKESYSGRWYGGSIARTQLDMDNICAGVHGRFKDCSQVNILRTVSSKLEELIPAGSLDWTYIDGNHSYDYVVNDLEISWQLTKPEAMIIGDDFDNSNEIRCAVKDFKNKYSKFITKLTLIEGQFIFEINKNL